MSIPYARRPPIPDIFRDPSTEKSKNGGVELKSAITDSVSSSVPSSSPPGLLPSPPISYSRRNCILPAPSEKKVKYVPSTRGYKVISRGFIRPKSPPPSSFDQNRSPVQTLGSASDDSTLVGFTPPLSKEKESFKVLRERTNSLSPPLSESKTLVPHDDDDETPKEFPSFTDTLPADANEEHVFTAVSTSIDGNMNMDATTAHLETAASLRSIRGTLNQLKKNRSHSRQSRPTYAKDIFTHKNETFNAKDAAEVLVSQTPAPETISDLISQLVDIVQPRIHSNHNAFMTAWSEMEIKTYNARWNKLVEKSKRVTYWPIARFSEIPWPVLPSVVISSSSSPDIITRSNVTRFLLCPHRDQDRTSMERIFAEIERWNDFELMGRVLKNVREADKKNVEMAWSRVVLVLMEMRGEWMAGRSLF